MKQTARRLTLGLSIAVVTVCAGCASDVRMPADSSSSAERPTTPGTVDVKTPRVLKKSELSEAEILYGRAPRPDPSVTYQDDVVIVEGGADAIRSVSPEGLLWTIDAKARKAQDLSVGKIAFLTDQCVGRVLYMKREGDNVQILLGPVQLTDIFRTLDVSVEQPIDLTEVVPLRQSRFNGLTYPVEEKVAMRPGATGAFEIRPASLSTSSVQNAPVSPGIPQRLNLTFHTRPLDNANGVGVEMSHESAGIKAVAQVQIRVEQPKLDFYLTIRDNKAFGRLILKNAAGLHLAFDAATNDLFSGNVKWTAPGSGFSLPIGGPAPISVTVRQKISVKTIFTARNGFFSAGGDYGINGDLGFAFQDDHFMTAGPKGITVNKSLMQNMNTISMGPMGLTMEHVLTVVAGIGIWEFTTGPSFELSTSLNVGQGGSTGIVQCQGASLSMAVRGGVGWTIPQLVADFVNSFLSIFRVEPIPAEGGSFTDWRRLFKPIQVQTESRVCGG